MHGACDITLYFLTIANLITIYYCYLLKIVYLLMIVAFCCSSSRGSDCNRDACSVSSP